MESPQILDVPEPGGRAVRADLGRRLGAYLSAATTDPQLMLPLWTAFSRGEAVAVDRLAAATSAGWVDDALSSGLLVAVDVADGAPWARAVLCVVPVALAGELVWVASDFPWYADEPMAVDGPGAATGTLRALVPHRTYGRILDLGSGSGALGASLAAPGAAFDAVDLNPRAVALTELTAALNGGTAHATVGDLAQSVGVGRYDLVVCNPPFVLGRPRERTMFRDAEDEHAYAGLAHDIAPLLAESGIGCYLTNWVYGPELPDPLDELAGDLGEVVSCDVLVLERAVVTVPEYVRLWTDDEDLAAGWAAGLAARGVTHVGTGAVVVSRTADPDGPGPVALARPYDTPLEELAALVEDWIADPQAARGAPL
ncbi:methyltransferase [Cumulibacter manganitolerans]|uniref:methyltransferase n=1 Tax=Cumulibacter manganitolerans TaxID=1884992 RepID=UPI001296EBA6|nr:methyltransferase [Cumulibacter manganitolerans]